MPHTIDDALSDDLITVLERLDEMGSYVIKIGCLETRIYIDLGRFRISEHTKFRVSHAIHTPLQAAPYKTSRPYADYWAAALHDAIAGLTADYRQALAAGHTPDKSWLVEN